MTQTKYKINKIALKNFKFFREDSQNTEALHIKLEGKNLLLYGENGSGKSSIYWGLYTFLQSIHKEDSDVQKYFDMNDPNSLVNDFIEEGEESEIMIEFLKTNSSNNPSENNTSEEISVKINALDIETKDHSFISDYSDQSDFINYKILFEHYNFSHSDEIDIFPLFEKYIFHTIDIGTSIPSEGDMPFKYTSNVWKELNLPVYSYYSDRFSDKIITNYSSDSYQTLGSDLTNISKLDDVRKSVFKDLSSEHENVALDDFPQDILNQQQKLLQFNIKFNSYLSDLFNLVNQILPDSLNVQLSYHYIFSYYTLKDSPNSRISEYKLNYPKLKLIVKFKDGRQIKKPQSYLNEAKLSLISLSIRLATLKQRKGAINSRVLVLDDLLLSLDMSNRDIVINELLTNYKDYQILFLTHDRGLYNFIKRRLESSGSEKEWCFKEMYQDLEAGSIKPFLLDSKSNLSLAQKYFKLFDYPACSNYLRKEVEVILKKILPDNKINIVRDTNGEGTRTLQLDTLIRNFEEWYSDLGFSLEPFKNLKEYKDLLLNPLSHDNMESPIYRKELENIFEILKKLSKIQKKTIGTITDEVDSTNIFELKEEDQNGDHYSYTFKLIENFYIVTGPDNTKKLNNPLIQVISGKNVTSALNLNISQQRIKLLRAYDQIRFKIRNKSNNDEKIPAKDLMTIVYFHDTAIQNIVEEASY
ncbi:hypothetical protein K4L44_05300 [Halosquirtibacter laminarini]|uniref:Uncharacterized protein n=1 Tax=Halosquirtibacter laminarini TaxID=3374600 RepID=A0AC61NHW3_9BACT|nr:hypothetical protein K4L44_05300 [Prolixibacteraceae bacterium]